MFVAIAGYMIQRCKNIPMKMKQKMEKRTQDEKIENHEDALIEMGYLKPKRKAKKAQDAEAKKKAKEAEAKKKAKDEKAKKKAKIEKTDSENEEEPEIA